MIIKYTRLSSELKSRENVAKNRSPKTQDRAERKSFFQDDTSNDSQQRTIQILRKKVTMREKMILPSKSSSHVQKTSCKSQKNTPTKTTIQKNEKGKREIAPSIFLFISSKEKSWNICFIKWYGKKIKVQ